MIAALTDALDGIIARRTNRITVTGAMLDPIADKLLISAAFISLVELGLAPAWMVTLIVGREFAVTGLRLIALERNVPISANMWGKAKTTTQIIAVSLLIFGTHLGPLRILGPLVLWVALILTVISMVVYFWQNWRIVREAEQASRMIRADWKRKMAMVETVIDGREVEVERENPYFPPGTRIRGHEFHYSRIASGWDQVQSIYAVKRGTGCCDRRDGVILKNVLASYLHLHAAGAPQWAPNFVKAASDYQTRRT